MSESLSLHTKLLNIQQQLKVPKNRENNFADFMYRNIEDIEDKVKPLLKQYDLTLRFEDSLVGLEGRVYIGATAILSNGSETITNTAYAREAEKPKSKTDDAQLTGACSSYARKYAASGLFLIDNTADSDSEGKGKTNAAKIAELQRAKAQVFEAFKKVGIDDSTVMLELIEKATGRQSIDNIDDAMAVLGLSELQEKRE